MNKVSILVPVYGVEKFIERCVRSLMQQTYPCIEYIFVDDCSLDNSIHILKSVLSEYPEKDVRIIRHEWNKGLGTSRKTALLASTGDYILNVDSDDYLEPDAVSLLMEEAEKTQADMVRMGCVLEWVHARKFYPALWSVDAKVYTKLLLNASTLPGICLHLIRRNLYFDYQLFPVEGINTGEDYVLTPRLSFHANRIAYVLLPLYHYMQINTSSYTAVFNQEKVANLQQVANILYNYFKGQQDYVSALSEGMWQKKVEIMLICSHKDYPTVDKLPTWLPMRTATMNLQQKIAAPLVAHHWWYLLATYSFFYHRVFNLFQKIKGR